MIKNLIFLTLFATLLLGKHISYFENNIKLIGISLAIGMIIFILLSYNKVEEKNIKYCFLILTGIELISYFIEK
jgi:hypothetical protein